MTEVILFLVVGGIAIAAAVLMLLSENAVHSALFLIVNFACVAFFYLMLNAPFLAMIQIAVYAGAIMVLFLFVIMLLGAEKLGESAREFRWLAPLALALAAAFLLITGVAIVQGQIDLQGPVTRPPLLRVVHAAEDIGLVNVYANGELVAEDVAFGDASAFEAVVPGEYTISLRQPDSDTVIANSQVVTLESNEGDRATAFTAIAYGKGSGPVIAVVPDDIETVQARSSRVTVFNAYTNAQAVNLVDFGSPNDPTDDRILVEGLQQEQRALLPPVPEDESINSWAFVNADNPANILFRLDNPEVYKVERDTSQLLILAGETVTNAGTTVVRPVAIPLVTKAVSSFGGPQAIGQLLFTRYMLPFQLVAVLLLAAMIGAIVLTHKESAVPRRRDVRRIVSKPLASAIAAQTGSDILTPPPAEEQPQLPEQQGIGD